MSSTSSSVQAWQREAPLLTHENSTKLARNFAMIIIIFAYMEPITSKGLELRTEDILSRLSEESLHYLFPGYDSRSGVPVPEGTMEEEEEEDSTIMFRVDPDDKPLAIDERKEIRWKKVVNKFESGIGSIFDMTVGDFYDDIEPKEKEKKKKPAEERPVVYDEETLKEEATEKESLDLEARKIEKLLAELDRIKAELGVTTEQIEAALNYNVKLSRMRVLWNGSITLTDFNREVKMGTLSKAVYILYLKHPEGISFKNLIDHRKELESIYMRMTGRSDIEAVRRSIDDLVNPILHNSINEKVSRIKRAFLNAVDEKVAKYYYIDGEKGEVRKIAIDRSMVVFW